MKLILRLLPDHSHLITIRVLGPSFAPKNRDRVSLISRSLSSNEVGNLNTSDNKALTITANTAVAAIWGLNHYLKYFCNSHISWDTTRIGKLIELPFILVGFRVIVKYHKISAFIIFCHFFQVWIDTKRPIYSFCWTSVSTMATYGEYK